MGLEMHVSQYMTKMTKPEGVPNNKMSQENGMTKTLTACCETRVDDFDMRTTSAFVLRERI